MLRFNARHLASRANELGIQMLSPALHRQLFPGATSVQRPAAVLDVAKKHLAAHGLLGKSLTSLPEINEFALPGLLGRSLDEHFLVLGIEQSHKFLLKLENFLANPAPQMPTQWVARPGWTRYNPNGTNESVDYPAGDALVFDVETIYRNSPFAALATAVGGNYWYSWLSPEVFDKKPSNSLIKLGDTGSERIIIGHHVAYDRARVLEEYDFNPPKFGWIDTLSLHCAIGGLSTQQRSLWRKYKKVMANREHEDADSEILWKRWFNVSSGNSLQDVADLYCGIKVDKAVRNEFEHVNERDIVENFQRYAEYCAKDVLITFQVARILVRRFFHKCPHPVSFAGILHMGRSYLPVNSEWKEFVAISESKYQKSLTDISVALNGLVDDALKRLDDGSWKNDVWLNKLDWTVEPLRMTKPVYRKDGSISVPARPHAKQKLPGKPKWYKDLWDTKTSAIQITPGKRAVPYLLKLKWMGFPLYFSSAYAWTFVVPKDVKMDAKLKPLQFSSNEGDALYDPIASFDNDNIYYKIPHKDGEKHNCGDPLGKSYVAAFESGILSSDFPKARSILDMNVQCAYWISARQRIFDQFVVWKSEHAECKLPEMSGGREAGVILPQSIVMGTVTRRAVEPTWMTASNAKKNRIGSELKTLVKAPKGYCMVGADVDSQELWISSVIGDSQFGIHGASAYGWMTLQGTKADGTDLHSKSASILGINRDNAKVFNYSRIYGAGVAHATQLLLQFSPNMDKQAAREKAVQLYERTKGSNTRTRTTISNRAFWHGGTESYMFNKLEDIAHSAKPITPTLCCEIPDSLLPENAQGDYMTSRINWIVQSSGVDYLHLILVSMDYLLRRFNIEARFMLAIHDEIRFLVKEEDKERAVLALQISNIWTRSLFASRLGFDDLPMSVAFFSSVDVDHCLRKEVDMECVTPSNPNPIPPGENVDVYGAIKNCKSLASRDGAIPGEPDEVKRVLSRIDHIRAKFAWYLDRPTHDTVDVQWLRAQMASKKEELNKLYVEYRKKYRQMSPTQPVESKIRKRFKRETVQNVDNFNLDTEAEDAGSDDELFAHLKDTRIKLKSNTL